MNQSKINAGGINQKPMHAVSTAIANSINNNAQSINSQCTEHQQSMVRASTSNAHCVNKQCVLHQQPMRIAPDSLMLGFSSTKTFTLCSMPLTPVILRGAEGEVAETILPEITLSLSVWGDRLQRPFSLCERSNSPTQRTLSHWERGDRLRWVRVMIASN